ncbi:MAG: ABC transporter permease subunit, partial [SAR324 cluster bacterium]|nr:ABC transporter permease subunit [SAR324 cluster bacterium]
SVSLLSLSIGLFLALQADRIVHGAVVYNTMLVWPYAISAAVAGVLWLFLFNPTIGIVAFALARLGYDWNHLLNSGEAMTLVIAAATWNRVPYNFLFFLAGLQSIPKSLVEASAIDGAGRFSRFWKIVFPLLMPTTFFLVVVNVVYAFFETFGVIHQITEGGPARATEILIYKVFYDGVIGLDLGGSAAQSVVLMTIVIVLTVIQFRYIESKVNY